MSGGFLGRLRAHQTKTLIETTRIAGGLPLAHTFE